VTQREPVEGPHSTFVGTLIGATVAASEEKLAGETVVLDLRTLVDSFDALVVTSGRNDRQVRAICEEIERRVALALDVKPLRVEGLTDAEWVALDYGDVIVHVFQEAAREYYDLEHLWSAAPSQRHQFSR
jgi:ribosome-associated protein